MSRITTHVLDLSSGTPAKDVSVILYRESGTGRVEIARAATDADGRIMDGFTGMDLEEGTYCIVFQTGPYFSSRDQETFFPHVEVVFRVADVGAHHHVPLLLSPWGYSTYRGS